MWLGRCRATAVRWQRGWWGWSPTCLEATPWWKTWTTGVSCLFRWGTKTESWGRKYEEWMTVGSHGCMTWEVMFYFVWLCLYSVLSSLHIFLLPLLFWLFSCVVLGLLSEPEENKSFCVLLSTMKLFSIECYTPLSNTFAINPSSPPPHDPDPVTIAKSVNVHIT